MFSKSFTFLGRKRLQKFLSACNFLRKADIVFLLDTSAREGAANFQKALDFVARLVNDLTIGSGAVQVAVAMTSSSSPQHEFYLDQYGNKAGLLRAIQSIRFVPSNKHTDAALKYVRTYMFMSAHGDRSDAPDYVIVLTDGASSNQILTLQQADILKQSNVNIIAIGIGNKVNKAEIQGMASDLSHEFEVDNFDALRRVREDIEKAACTGKHSPVASRNKFEGGFVKNILYFHALQWIVKVLQRNIS